jgi:magnesium transporter
MWPPRFPSAVPERVRVVLATRTLLSFISTWRATALVLVELGAVAFFASGVAEARIGPSAPWFLLSAVIVGVLFRAVDIEARALFVPGGLFGSVREALGGGLATVAVSTLAAERLLLGPVAAAVAGRYLASFSSMWAGADDVSAGLISDVSTAGAVAVLAYVWLVQRRGRWFTTQTISRAIAAVVVVLVIAVLWGAVTAVVRDRTVPPLPTAPQSAGAILVLIVAFGRALFGMGSVDALSQVAPVLEPPRIRNLERTAWFVCVFSFVITGLGAVVIGAIVPDTARIAWLDAPLAGLAAHVIGPPAARFVLMAAIVVAAAVLLMATVRNSMAGVQGVVSRLVEEGLLSPVLRTLHPRFGTPWRVIDATVLLQIAIVLVGAGRPGWLVAAYAVGLLWSAAFKVAALIRFRSLRPAPRAFQVPFNVTMAGRVWPIGLWLAGVFVVVPSVAVLAAPDAGTFAGSVLVLVLAAALLVGARRAARQASQSPSTLDEFQLLPSHEVDLQQVEARPGNLLVPVRKPHVLTHLEAALHSARDRDVVVMTVRIIGVDVPDDPSINPRATDDEKRLLSAVVALAERHGRAIRLLIAPGVNVFDAVAETALRLQSAEIHVGESETLPAQEQARLLGEAWERASGPKPLGVRLVIHHPTGTTASYQLGAHPPSFDAGDLDLIHKLWLDVVNAVGAHVHHRDVVRAALKLMENELKGPDREAALGLVRETARPGDELAAIVRARDFTRLRDLVRNWPPSALARALTDLPLDEQVVVFRILPRKDAAATFEYLSTEQQEGLLKGMAQEDVAALLNNMAPDERTKFLEELPASATRQLLALLTPQERAVAVTLLGYPEGSIGRLMTPHYISVKEEWTVQAVLDHIRRHGRDSETLNVIYVVDELGLLIDDIRIREFLLTEPTRQVRDLMDRRFVALKATDDQETAVAVFRREDRSALPVTDTAGVLIGIITVDDVLDVAEAEATEDIQRVGGMEALEEPYMQIALRRMIQKRGGWLTALFLGEMLTATAMGFFEMEIERAVVLALFVPLIISSGGNSGSQASTLVIRALALGEVSLGDWWRVMRRELGAGLALGGILGTIGFFRIAIWSAFSTIYGPHWLLVALTVAVSLVGVVLWGTLTGSLLPFLLRRLGFDPAASSAPFVATLVDVTGLVIYFSVALVILHGTLL